MWITPETDFFVCALTAEKLAGNRVLFFDKNFSDYNGFGGGVKRRLG